MRHYLCCGRIVGRVCGDALTRDSRNILVCEYCRRPVK